MKTLLWSVVALGMIVLSVRLWYKSSYLPRKRDAEEEARHKRESLKQKASYIPRAADTISESEQGVYNPKMLGGLRRVQ